jgi:hypothetical protein
VRRSGESRASNAARDGQAFSDGSRSKHHGYTGFSEADGAGAALLAAGGAIVGESVGTPAVPGVGRLQPQAPAAQST